MTDIAVNVTNNRVPINGLTDAPEITIRRLDTGAAVVTAAAMTDRAADGLYTYNFAETIGIPYGFLVDADPAATTQVSAQERYYNGAFSNDSQIIRDSAKLAPSPGAPAAGSIDEHLDDILTDTSIMEPIVSANLDVAVSTRNSVVPLAAAADQAEHDATQAAIAALNDLSQADVQAALTAQGYTVARAGNLDNLDVAVSTRNSVTPLAAAVDQAEHDATQAAIAALNDLDAQAIRDAMKLAPSAGLPAAGSIDDFLADILADTAIIEPIVSANLDVAVSTRNAVVPMAAATSQAEHDATQAAIAALNDLSIADVQTALTNQGYTAARALLLDNLDVAVSTRSSHTPADVDTVLTAAHGAGSWTTGGGGGLTAQDVRDAMKLAPSPGAPAADSIDDKLDGLETDIAGLNDLSQADVQAALTAQGYTVARAGNLDNLDVAVSTRNSVVPLAAAVDQAEHDTTQAGIAANLAAIGALNDLSIADVQTALDNQGYTALRAVNLDNLDATVSSRSSHDENDVDTVLTAAHGAGSWTTGGGGPSLTQQQVRDAMLLAPSPGAPALDSVDEKLDSIEVDTNSTDTIVQANLDATISSRATPADILATEAVIVAAIAALNDLSIADVQAALTAQGYTPGRAVALDNLDATVSSRSTVAGILAAVLTSGDSVDVALSRLDNIDADVATNIPALIAALNDLSIADVQTALTAQGYTPARAGNLDNLDVAVSSVGAAVAALNDISVADILTATLASGNTVDAELSGILSLRDFIEGGRDIDFTGNDALGWQRIERNIAGTLVRRYNLFDENGARINESVGSFIGRAGMISAEVPI